MKDASGSRQVDNGAMEGKVRVRRTIAAALPPGARILEGFAGEGAMYDAVWAAFPCGLAIDHARDKVRTAARRRPDWSVYAGDTERALSAGVGAAVPFDVVDLDAYGSPWKYVRAWLLSERARADRTTVVLTDGYMARASLSALDGTLFHGVDMRRMNVPPQLYFETVRARLSEWCETARLTPESFDTYQIQHAAGKIPMRAHVLRFGRLPAV